MKVCLLTMPIRTMPAIREDAFHDGSLQSKESAFLSPNDHEQVEQGKAALLAALVWREKSQWAIGDAALLIAPVGEIGVNTGRLAVLEGFIRTEVEGSYELSFNTVRVYRTVAAAWPPDSRIAATWSVHQVLVAEPNRHLIREGMTKAEALRARAEAVRQRLATETRRCVSGGSDLPAAFTLPAKPRVPHRPPPSTVDSDDLVYLRQRIGRMLTAWAAESSRVALSLQAATSDEWPDAQNQVEYKALLDTIAGNLDFIQNTLHGRLTLETELEALSPPADQFATR